LQCLLSGRPLLLLPTHFEQSIVAANAARFGAAVAVLPSEQHPKFQRRIENLLHTPSYREAAQRFADRYQQMSAEASLERALATCETRADLSRQRTKLVSVG
jgi:UDP:flavonoid glycosyltransferase YjiC (YdhE family)